ncbi:MAG: CHAT domain-containing protein [Okeania sp. SIO3B5]|uniref:CHAT domain-containing protein n=1 Tax=Okeania sp. SIO3B5 TaxID=2607811 RepID=UPI001400C633|nr:HEAT repeat domain-containing protein [Okeania sp. SIO3B5]NEO55631.1 CHAT domain-containing protein [Okeania sp. SIO3B5]
MKTLKLFLTVPENSESGKIQINIDNYGSYQSKLPGSEDVKKWLIAMINALDSREFTLKRFNNFDERNWMVNQGWLNEAQTNFTSDILKKIGQDIYQTLFPSLEARELLSRRLGTLEANEQLHIQLQFSAKISERGRLPDYLWELACDDRSFLTEQKVTFSRLIAFPKNVPNFPTVEQINVLLVSSTVGDTELGLLNLDFQEQEAIYESLKKAEIAVECKKNISFKELGDYLTQIPLEKTPHIIHFDGHGYFGKRCNKFDCCAINKSKATHCRKCNSPLEKTPQGYLLFKPNIDDREREADYISAKEISDLIQNSNFGLENQPELGVRLVVMSACKSGWTRGSDSVFNGIAQQLIAQQIPAVVAMQYNVIVDAATAFAERFYQALANRKPLTTAVSVGQTAMGREGNQWYRPVLYLRWENNDGGRLFGEDTTLLFERYVENLVTKLEAEKGVLEYIDLFAETSTSLSSFVPNSQSSLAPGLDNLASSYQSNQIDENNVIASIENIVANHQKFVLIGEPGSGKSTALKHLALTQAKEFLSDKFTAPMPFILELEFWSKDIKFDSFVQQQWQEFQLLNVSLQDFFTKRDVILYLDGLEAILGNSERRVNRVNQIKKWLRRSQALQKVIVTCRSDYYQDDDINLGLSTFEIQPMSTDLIRSFVSQELNDKSENFLKQIFSNGENQDTKNSIQQLASNPYLLYALIIIYQYEPGNKLPQNSGALFSRLVKALWKREREKPNTELLSYSEVETYFADLANYIFQQDSLIVKRETAISILNNDRNLLLAGKSANLLVVQDNTVRFKNRLIQDYFLAVTLKSKGLNSILKKPTIFNGKRLIESWDYPIIALSGLVNEPNEIIKQIAEKDPYLSAMCLDSGVKVNDEALEFIVTKLVQTFDITIQDNFEEIIQYEKIGETKKLLAQYYLNRLGTDTIPILGKILINPQKNAFIKRAIIDLLDMYNDIRIIHSLSEIVKDSSIEEKAIQLANQQLLKLKAVITASSVGGLALAAVTSNKTSKVLSKTQDAWDKVWGNKSQNSQLELRIPAIYALSRLKNQEATLPLIDGLIDANNDVRQACLTSLKSSGWQPETNKEQLYLTIAENRWSDCQAFGELAISPLLSVLNDETEAIQISVITTLGELGLKAQDAVVPILNKLFDKNTTIVLKKTCIEAIGLIPTKITVIGLLKALQTLSEDLQDLALEKLNNIDEKQKLAGLIYALEVDFDSIIQPKTNLTIGKILKGDENTKFKIAAIETLGKLGSVDAINILLSTMNQENEKLVIACINALSNHKQLNVISAIVEKLKDDKNSIKKEAIKSLGKLQAETAVDELVKLLPSRQKKKRFGLNISKISNFFEADLVGNILGALQQIGTPEAEQAIDSWNSENK